MKNVFITTLLALYCSIPAMPVTLNVKVPEGTKQCYVVGDFNKWSTATAVEMQSSGENTYTVNIEDVTVAQMEKGYKYLNGRDWTYVEKDADGNEIDNRTKVQELDVVASWNALLNTVTQKCTLTVNGYERNVEIYVPKNYDNETEHYPVIYYTGVHQHYSEAGSDGPGESFFDSRSWDAANIIENAVDNYGAKPAIVVAIYGFVAEQIPYANADFMGSGQSEAFLKGIVDEVMPYVNKNYRTLTGAQNTTLMGADLGGLFSVYATIKHPEIFGKCVSMSPMLWLNMNELTNLAASANFATPARFFLSSGDRELDIITDNVAQISNILSAKENTEVQKIVFAGGIHNDLSWATQLPTAFCFAQGGTAPLPESFTMAPAFVPNEENDIFSTEYSVLTGFDTKELTYDSSLKFMTIDEYFSSANQPTKTKVLTTTIPADFKGTYYWNISRSADGTGELLFEEPRNISFSSKKSTDSWHRIVMYSENDIKNIAASSAFFRICYGEEK